ncbi:HtaA domain-containing protein [Conexibacter stalactiti]|uniref:HtaA domain-containing protein n=1 Tax=Conexibacter stalactiti TaxID=1940611 RepID=A0ABU4HRQ5_9ACTN|nr:HtaA domain-containing protein [Conexibacter stalactiti]MDW5595424.1 HtaA domain-containing protein [Conexibacter stalactiti]MEC5036066.1 HtaA domain-containing protein [Conexibacter stalactiti]
MSHRTISRSAWQALIAALLAAAMLVATAATAPARADAAGAVAITEGEGLLWGMKLSWRNYTGIGTWSGGVEYLGGADGYRWPFRSGSYDPETHRAELQFGGTVRWTGHEGALDMTMSDPRLTIDGDDARLSVKVISRSESTGRLEDFGEISLVTIALRADALRVADGRTSWSALATALTADGARAFSRNYPTGNPMDSVSTTYTGPGGLPRSTEEPLVAAGSLALSETARVTPDPERKTYGIHYDYGHNLLHTVVGGGDGLVALDPATLAPVGTPFGSSQSVMFENYPASTGDPNTGMLFDSRAGTTYAFEWDSAARSYSQTTLPGTFTANVLTYDRHSGRLFAANGDELVTWKRESGAWVQTRYTRRGVSMNADARAALAVDGYGDVVVTAASQRPVRLTFDGTTATASYLPGDYSNPTAVQEQFNKPTTVQPIPSGGFYLTNYHGQVFTAQRDEDGVIRQVGERVRLGLGTVLASAMDIGSGSFMAVDTATNRIGFVERSKAAGVLSVGSPIGVFVLNPVAVAAGANGTVYVSSERSLIKYERVAYAASVTTAPQDVTIPLAAGVESGTATFTAAATGRGWGGTTATPTVRWQTRAGATGRFADIPGATAGTLTLPVTADDNGRQVRAIFTNVAGQVAAPATITVNTAAAIAVQPADVAVTSGTTAELKVMPVGNPAPQIQWQRKVGGFWTDVDAESGDFDVDGGFLRVPNAAVEMDGAQFRARLRNQITPGSDAWSTVFTRTVTLKVSAPVTSAVTFGGGTLDWGFANRWRCYIVGNVARGGIVVSGGATQVPGTLATGNLCDGRDAGSEIVRFGIRGGSYDPATKALELRLRGSVRFWGHDYHVPGSTRPQLDTTFSNLRLVANGATGTLYADTNGSTMEAPDPVSRTNVPLVTVTLPSDPVGRDGGLDWSGLETALTSAGRAVFGNYPEGEPFDPIALSATFGTPEPDPQPQVTPVIPAPPTTPVAPVAPQPVKALEAIVPGKTALTVNARRVAQIARLNCPAGGRACTVTVPKRVTLKIAGKRLRAIVLAPRTIAAGRSATVRVQLTKAAAKRLAGRRTTVSVRVKVSARGGRTVTRVVKVTLKGAKKKASR